MLHECLIISAYFLLSKFSLINSFSLGSAQYPEPNSILYSSLIFATSSSRFSFARIEAAETTAWFASALCSHCRHTLSGLSKRNSTSDVHDLMLGEGQSITTAIFSFSFVPFTKWFMILAVLIASR